MRILVVATALLVLSGAPATAQHQNKHDDRVLAEDPRLAEGQLAPILEGLGENHFPVTTNSDRAQMFFDQALLLTYGFNHQEALRSFKEVARLDPDCAMAYWGWALVLGPNLNLPMRPTVVEQAYEAVRMAMDRRAGASPKERALIEALATRYSDDPESDRAPLDAAYADAMQKVHERYPDDNDVAALYAAALMNLSAWDYWEKDGRPKGRTRDVTTTLEAAIGRDPHHEGALHYYIHIVEPVDPPRAERVADLLRGLAPGAGHLTHMPSHIYMQVGRYAEAYEANAQAAKADEGYITQCRAQGIYPLNYYPHNVHFLVWAAVMQGRSADALAGARKVASKVPADMHGNDWALYQSFLSMPLATMVRFGMWDEIKKVERPDEDLYFLAGFWHYAQGMAFLRSGERKQARREFRALESIVDDPEALGDLIGFSNAEKLLRIACNLLAGEIAAAAGKFDTAVVHLDRAARLEDALLYNEPPDWFAPVRHTLGAVLLEAGRPVEAEVVYWDDLERYPDNGFSLRGLGEAMKAQGRDDEAAQVAKRFKTAWADADVELSGSRF
jgi:tetratricopeptide (TPR) repeat protein